MKLKKAILSVVACALSFVLLFSLAACGDKEPKITAIALDKTEVTLATGEVSRLVANATYGNDTTEPLAAGDVEWSSSAESVASVNRGVISGKAKGTAKITATYGTFTATCDVTVYTLTVELNKTEAAIEKGTTEQLTATVKKDGTAVSGEEIEWTSSEESVATVDANGLVSAWKEGTAEITAKRKNGTQTATCAVTVSWANKPASYEEIINYEQNKTPVNTWGYWNDHNYNWTESTVYEAYTEDYETGKTPAEGYSYIGAQKANLQFKMDNPGVHNAAVQFIYRSAGEGGKLEINHNYELTLKLYSNVAGTVVLNTYGDVAAKREKAEDESEEDYAAYEEAYEALLKKYENKFEIAAGENTLKVEFRHGDWGDIYPTTNYNNVESAIHLLLGNLEGRVSVSVYDIQFKHLGEAENKTEQPDFNKPVELPDLSDTEAIALDISAEDADEPDKYTITTADEGKTYNVVYTGTLGNSYKNVAVEIPENAKVNECNIFAVTITNNGTETMNIRFDINGTTASGANNVIDIVKSSVASVGTPATNLEYGGTALAVEAGKTTTLYLTYDVNTERGAATQILMYFDTIYEGDGTTKPEHSGNVTIGSFKFAKVEKKAPTLPDFGNIEFETDLNGKDKYASLSEEGGKAVYSVHQVLTFEGKTDAQIIEELTAIDNNAHTNGLFYNTELSALTKEGVEAALAKMHIDFEGNGNAMGGSWGAQGSVKFISATATVTKDGDVTKITFDAKYDVTETAVGAYTNHFGYGWGDNGGNPEMKGIDFKPGFAYKSEAITVGDKTYLVVVVPDNTDGTFFWGCAGLFVLA